MKKKIALLLCLALCLSVFGSLSVVAANDEVTYSVGGVVDTSVTTLANAIKAANELTGSDEVTIKLLKNVTCNTALKYVGAGKLTFDGNGCTINTTLGGSWVSSFAVINASGELVVKNLTLINSSKATMSNNSVVRAEKGKVTVNNCHFETVFTLFNANLSAGTNAEINIDVGTYLSSYTGEGAFLWTKNNSGMSANSTISVSNATFIATNTTVADNWSIVLGQRASGYGDTVTFTNTSIYAPNYLRLLRSQAADTSVTFNSSNVYFSAIKNMGSGTYPVRLDKIKSLTFKNTYFVGGMQNAMLNGSLYGSAEGIGRSYNSASTATAFELPALQAESSVRIDQAGIRFRTIIESDWEGKYKTAAEYLAGVESSNATVSYGTLVVLQSKLDEFGLSTTNCNDTNIFAYNLSHELLKKLGIGYVDIVADKGITTDSDGNIEYVAALDGITEAYYGEGIATIAYAKVTIGGTDYYFYSSFNPSDNTHTIADVAQQAITKNDYSGDAELAKLQAYVAGKKEGN